MNKKTNELISLAQIVESKYSNQIDDSQQIDDPQQKREAPYIEKMMSWRVDLVGKHLSKMSISISDIKDVLEPIKDIIISEPNSPEYDFYVALNKLVEAYDQAFSAYDELPYAK